MRLDHAIFHEPLDAKVRLEPHEWEQAFDPRGTWEVQTGELGSGKGNDYGMVSDGHGFEDSPDAERISGGVNSKGPYAIAIGRQANLLQWGFYAAPDRMTESARTAFLNAIVYMQRFDGHRPLVKKLSRGRGWYRQYLDAVRSLDSMEEASRESYGKYLRTQFPADLIEKVGLDADALQAWVDSNIEYVRGKPRTGFEIDEDLRALELSNRRPEFLSWLQETLTADADHAVALRLAARYLGDHGRDAAAALAWIAAHGESAFFSDQGGYRWYADPLAEAERSAKTGASGGDGERR